MIPDREQLDEARRFLDLALQPAGVQGVRQALMPLFLVLAIPNTEDMSDQTQQAYFAARATEYERHLQHIPADILKAACDAHVRTEKFFPAISELLKYADPLIERRKAQQHRVGRLIEMRAKPRKPTAEPFVQEPEHIRLLAVIKWQEKPGSNLYSPTNARATRARLTELGVDAGEMPADVAAAPLPTPPVQVEPPPKVGTFKSASLAAASAARPSQSSVDLTRARAAFWKRQGRDAFADKLKGDADAMAANRGAWRAGEPVYQHPAEDLPAPDAIPEAEF